MKQVAIQGTVPPIRTAKYVSFRGVDMTTDPSKVDSSRSPFAPNLIADSGGFPEKRLGWRTLQTVEQPVNGMFATVIGEQVIFVAHGGTKLYTWTETGTPAVIRTGVKNGPSTAFSMNGKLWILTGSEYLVYDGQTVKSAEEEAYIPTTIIARAPAGGGTVYESVNLIQPKRRNFFLADGTSKEYQLDSTGIDSGAVEVTVDDAAKTEGTDFTVNRTLGKVTFTTAPPEPVTAGKDNVKITFSKTVSGYANRVKKCRIAVLYGLGTNDRVFLAGNPDYPSTDWHSGITDPAYIPDLNYARIGSENTEIMGYHKIGEYLAIVKEDNNQDSTIFLRSAKLDTVAGETKTTFPVKQGVVGVGAISRRGFANLKDEPLFLSRSGVYGITSNVITAERTVQNRSYFVDSQLTKENNLSEAVCAEWDGLFLVCVNSRCYILDGRQNKSYKPQSNGDYVYECYHWENIPAVCFMEYRGTLYFGTAEGKICRFNSDMTKMDKYSDDGEAITCYWSTKADDDGDFMSRKTMLKKGSGLMIKPYTRSHCKILIRTDKDFEKEIRSAYMDIFDWEDIDFNRFSFNTNDGPQVVPFLAKVKKYITMQIIVKNDGLNEGFGVFGIIKRYTTGNYVK